MLGGALTRQRPLVLALDPAEEAVAVHLAQVEKECVEPGVFAQHLCLEPLKGKLDFFVQVKDLLDEALAEIEVPSRVIDRHGWGYLGRLGGLVVFDRAELEVLGLAVLGGPNY